MATPTLTLTLSSQTVGFTVSYSGNGSTWSSGTLTYTTNPNDTSTYHNINLPWTGLISGGDLNLDYINNTGEEIINPIALWDNSNPDPFTPNDQELTFSTATYPDPPQRAYLPIGGTGSGTFQDYNDSNPATLKSTNENTESGGNRFDIGINFLDMCFAPFTKIPKVIEIKDAKKGDIIRTSRGDWPLTKLIKTHTGETEYVKFSKNCLGCIPRDDFYVTGAHPINLAFIPNEWLINDFDNKLYDEATSIQIDANSLVGKLPGIIESKESFGVQYQMVFDDHTTVDTEGLDCLSHHPRCTPMILPEKEFLDPLKFNKKTYHHTMINYSDLMKFKPDNMELQVFLRKCLTHDPKDKFEFTKEMIINALKDKEFNFINKNLNSN